MVDGARPAGRGERARTTIAVAALLALALFLSTLQLDVNGSEDRYATDVGEIQNALPRWGTIHFTGYPQYTALGSLFVNGLHLVGLPPAAGASLFSALWGAAAAGLLAALVLQFSAPAWTALLAALLFSMSKSMWIDGSIAELHTMTMALTFAALLLAVCFWRSGSEEDLYWLVFVCSQGLTHQRAFAFLAPALAVLVARHWRVVLQNRLPVLALALSGPITYLYLPLVDWLGSEWVFSAPGTWQGFWALVLDTKAERIISIPQSLPVWRERLAAILGLLNDDWPPLMWVGGLLGLAMVGWGGTSRSAVGGRPLLSISNSERAALALTWLVYLALSLVIWEGYVSDALLAVKLPVIAMAAVGLALAAAELAQRSRVGGRTALVGGVGLALLLFFTQRPEVLQITRDPGANETIAVVQQVGAAEDERPITFVALWGNDFWQLAYAQAYQGQFSHLNLVDHNASFREILARGEHLYTLSRTFVTWPLPTWEARLGRVQLASVTPGVVEICSEGDGLPCTGGEQIVGAAPGPDLLALGNDIAIQEATLRWQGPQRLLLAVTWRALAETDVDYSVAVHLVSQNPPMGPQHLLAQADSAHPVQGWYPTSRWAAGELVRDHYVLTVPPGSQPVAVRLGMYQALEGGEFENSEVLGLALPAEES